LAFVAVCGSRSLRAQDVTSVGVTNDAALAAFKAANDAYGRQNYRAAVQLYDDVVRLDPDFGAGYFFAANSYDNLYVPSKRGQSDNDALLAKAIAAYRTAADKLVPSARPAQQHLGVLALQYLVAAYGPDKLNDPGKAALVLGELIRANPSDPLNYFALARMRDDAGAAGDAERTLLQAGRAAPDDPRVELQLAAHYARQGQFEKMMEALRLRGRKDPNNPEAFYTIATYAWDQVSHDTKLSDAEKMVYIQQGLEAVDRALQLKADYLEALLYKGLLIRAQAMVEPDRAQQDALMTQADALRAKAEELRTRRGAAPSQR
jgi:tetratricopeptide (TPR) repeat protein